MSVFTRQGQSSVCCDMDHSDHSSMLGAVGGISDEGGEQREFENESSMKERYFKESVSAWCRTSNRLGKLISNERVDERALRNLQDEIENEFTLVYHTYDEMRNLLDTVDPNLTRRYEQI